MKRVYTVLSLVLLLACNAGAVGLGGYLTGATGQSKNDDQNSDFTHLGVGLVLDTAVEKDTLFNYRLGIGYNKKEYKTGGDVDQYAMNNVFGFGILRNDSVRLWLGPELILSYSKNQGNDSFFGGGIGPVLGANVHLTDLLSLSFSVDATYSYLISDNADIDPWSEWKVGGCVYLIFKMGDRYSR